MFGTMSEEQRQKAQLVRKEKREKGLSTYKTDWLDDSHWAELAREANIKLPQHHVAPSGIRLDKIAKQLGVELGEAFFGVGHKTTSSSIKKENLARPEGSKYNMRMYVGLLLELWKEKDK